MAGNAVTQLLQSRGDPVEQRSVLRGYVSTLLPAPTGFPEPGSDANLLWVITPEYSTDRPLGPCQWSADHGTSLPTQGAAVVVAIDAAGIPTVVWWEGMQQEPEPSEWTKLTLGTKVEAGGAGQSPAVRGEAGNTVARLRGTVAIKSGQTLTAGETLATLAVGLRPPAEVFTPTTTTAGTSTYLLINSSGVIAAHSILATGVIVLLDSLTFNLT